MAIGGAALVLVAAFSGGFAVVGRFGAGQVLAVTYLAVFGGAIAFFLWVFALQRTTPTRVASTMTVNPIAASLLAALIVSEPIGLPLLVGIVAVGVGIWVATTERLRATT
jgi:drug/metabolite transporter (DMT)-like permease